MAAKPTFGEGWTSTAQFAQEFIGPLFESGTITPHPRASHYAIAYGELGAYTFDGIHLASWSVGVPDCTQDIVPGQNYVGRWKTV